MVATMLSLVVGALLVALVLGSTLHSGNKASTNVSGGPGVAMADAVQAQQSLSTALSTADAAATASGGFGSLTPAGLSAAEPTITFVSGPSRGATTVSVAIGSAQPGLSTGGPDGSLTLADRSSDGTCWLVWKGGGATWYGAQTSLASCSAPALTTPPTPGPVSSSGIGWQQGSFPAP